MGAYWFPRIYWTAIVPKKRCVSMKDLIWVFLGGGLGSICMMNKSLLTILIISYVFGLQMLELEKLLITMVMLKLQYGQILQAMASY